jgi:hypothetical protein
MNYSVNETNLWSKILIEDLRNYLFLHVERPSRACDKDIVYKYLLSLIPIVLLLKLKLTVSEIHAKEILRIYKADKKSVFTLILNNTVSKKNR